MNRRLLRNSCIRATYRRRVTEQMHIDGQPVFRPEIIGQWSEEAVAYFANGAALDAMFSRWGDQHPWQYEITSATGIPERAVPPGTMVFVAESTPYYIAA